MTAEDTPLPGLHPLPQPDEIDPDPLPGELDEAALNIWLFHLGITTPDRPINLEEET